MIWSSCPGAVNIRMFSTQGVIIGEGTPAPYPCQPPRACRDGPVTQHQAYQTARYSSRNKGQKYGPRAYVANGTPILGQHFRPLPGGEGPSPEYNTKDKYHTCRTQFKDIINISNYSPLKARRLAHPKRVATPLTTQRHRKARPAGQRLSVLQER